jgi:hydroxyacylglutathione hydrolase
MIMAPNPIPIRKTAAIIKIVAVSITYLTKLILKVTSFGLLCQRKIRPNKVCLYILPDARIAFVILETLALGDYQTNCYIYAPAKGKKGFIIDPGDEARIIFKRIKELDLSIDYIILTHGHPDHTGALKQVHEATGAPILMHGGDAPMLKDKLLHSLLGFTHAHVEAHRILVDSEILETGELGLKVIHTPGHTPGCICLLGDGMVFTGDTLFNKGIGRTDLPGGDAHLLMMSIYEKLLSLPDETIVYPGHGPSSTIGDERRGNPFLSVY